MKPTILLSLSMIILFSISACSTIEKEPVVDFGKTITFDYAAGFDNGTLYDTTFEIAAIEAGIYDPNKIYAPVSVVYGEDLLFAGLRDALLGMKENETKNVRVPPNKAYGTKIKNSTIVFPKTKFDNYENLKINDLVTIVSQDGRSVNSYVKEIGEENIVVDLNHPLAGYFVQFAILVRSIE